MNKIELLSPSGNMACAKAAVLNGADAIYCALKNFGARSFAGNFDHDEMIELVHFAHMHNVKVYVTMNTLLNEYEISNAMKEVDFLYHHDVDALLIQDLGLLNLVLKCYPDFDVHASTQMHVHNVSGVKVLKELGVKRIVLARETPIEIIRECAKTGADIEVFSYGALCVCYSGQCLMSALTQNRSGNKGMCAQSCRMKYDGYNKNDLVFKDQYLLSPKDLNIIEHIPEIIEAGVSSLKIEGRMKRPEYVALVTCLFRKAIDAFYDNKPFKLTDYDLRSLKLMFNREFTEGLIFHKDKDELFNMKRPNHVGIPLGKIKGFNKNRIIIHLNEPLYQNDGIRFIQKEDQGLTVNYIYKKGLLVNHGDMGDDIEIECLFHVDKNAEIVKTTDVKLIEAIHEKQLNDSYKMKVDMIYEAKKDKPFRLTLSANGKSYTMQSSWLCEEAKNKATSADRIKEQLSKTGNSLFQIGNINGEAENVFIPISLLNHLRNDILECFEKECALYHKERTNAKAYKSNVKAYESFRNSIEINTAEQYEALKDKNYYLFTNNHALYSYDNLYPITDIVNEKSIYPAASLIKVSEAGGLDLKCRKMASRTLNVSNSYAMDFLYEKGFINIEVSYELNEAMINASKEAFNNRNGFYPSLSNLIYGSVDLMVIKGHFAHDRCTSIRDYQNNDIEILKDDNDISHLVFKKAGFRETICDNIVIRLVNEDRSQIERVLKEIL